MGIRKVTGRKPFTKPATTAKAKTDEKRANEKTTEVSDEDLQKISGGTGNSQPPDVIRRSLK